MADLQTPLVRPKRKKVLVEYLVRFRWIETMISSVATQNDQKIMNFWHELL
jgi:hypothetical protein